MPRPPCLLLTCFDLQGMGDLLHIFQNKLHRKKIRMVLTLFFTKREADPLCKTITYINIKGHGGRGVSRVNRLAGRGFVVTWVSVYY